MRTREDDIQAVIDGVLDIDPNYFEPRCGPEEYTCPFCGGCVIGTNYGSVKTMQDITHDMSCAWLIAKDLNTK